MLKYTQQSFSIGPNVVNVLHAKALEYRWLLIALSLPSSLGQLSLSRQII